MKALAFGVLLIAGCAEPSLVESINIDVNHDHAYSHYIRRVNEARDWASGELHRHRLHQKASRGKGRRSLMFACKSHERGRACVPAAR